MLAKDLISDSIYPLKTSDSGTDALIMMDEFRVSHLPIVNDIDFLGLISDEDIYNMNDPDQAVGNHQLSLNKPYILKYQHFFEVLRILTEQKLSLLPVVDDKLKYHGVICLSDIVRVGARLLSADSPGGIIILELNLNDYVLSEIASIIESNDAKVLSFFVSPYENSTKMALTIKINKMELGPILQTFNRYNYIIKASMSEQDDYDDLMDNYDSLMNYLNI